MENCPEPPPSNPDPDRCTTCPALPREDRYRLPGPQVEPEASFWQFTGDCCPRLCAITIEDLTVLTDDPASPNYFPPYPTDTDVLRDEIHELIELASLRDDPEAVASTSPCRERRDISPFLQYRPQPLGAVVNMERDPAFRVIARGRDAEPNLRAGLRGEEQDAAVPVVRTGRELARYFEAETPGLAHRHALNLLLRDADWSPPRQAWVWAALDVTIYSALAAAWYYKWLADHADSPSRKTHGRTGSTSYRPRPFEADSRVGVLYNREVSPLGDGDGRRRVGPVDPQPSPGTPRHPAYPSGHSTYSAAASELLSWFFPDYREEFNRLADNAGMARLWAGIHWRSDHVQGQRLGRTVACLVVRQLVGSYIPRTPDECEPPCPGSVIMPDPDVPPACRRPPEPDDVAAAAKARHECCEGRRGRGKGAAPAPGAPGGPEADRARGPQQGARGGALGGASAERSRGPQQGAR
jgi:membrane-associated phospholipid phosphatase